MIETWTLANFKSVRGPETLEFAPLTLFAGANSSGKSTVLQSILLVSQTLASRMSARHLVLNGELARLGHWSDLVHSPAGKEAAGTLTVGVRLSGPRDPGVPRRPGVYTRRVSPDRVRQIRGVTLSATFGSLALDTGAEQPILVELDVFVDTLRQREPAAGEEPVLETHRLSVRRRADIPTSVLRVATGSPAMMEMVSYQMAAPGFPGGLTRAFRSRGATERSDGAELSHFLPRWAILLVDMREERLLAVEETLRLMLFPPRPSLERHRFRTRIEAARRSDLPEDLLQDLNEVLTSQSEQPPLRTLDSLAMAGRLQGLSETNPERATVLVEQMAERYQHWREHHVATTPEEPTLVPTELAPIFGDALEHVRQELAEAVAYLGPLRDDPKPVYALPPSPDPSAVGLKGEYTAAVLDSHRGLVRFVPPNGTVPEQASLLEAVQTWLRHFRLADSVKTESAGKLGHTIVVESRAARGERDLTSVGVGVSQVLPILVMSLASEEGAILIFEQPEIHLHPMVQSLLADFFIALTRSGRQCIVETHSEYIVNRLRLRIAEDATNELADNVSLYFVERPEAESKFRRIRINEFGAITDWPQDFFDEGPSEADRIMQASLRRRRERTLKP